MSKAKKVYPDPMQCDTCKQTWPLEFFPRCSNRTSHSLSCDSCIAEEACKVRAIKKGKAA